MIKIKEWIKKHIAFVVIVLLFVVIVLVLYFVVTNMCWDCPPTNITAIKQGFNVPQTLL